MIFDSNIARKVANYLLEKQAVILRPNNPFTWASGWKSPIYCDNRVLLSYPDVRSFIRSSLGEVIRKEFYDAGHIVGVATAGIPQAALVADLLNLPLAYARTKAKDHGTGGVLEGRIEKSSGVVVIEDLISTGGSSFQVVNALREEGYMVIGLLAIFSYDFPIANEEATRQNIKLITLSDYNVLSAEALRLGYINESDLELLISWRKNPSEWGR